MENVIIRILYISIGIESSVSYRFECSLILVGIILKIIIFFYKTLAECGFTYCRKLYFFLTCKLYQYRCISLFEFFERFLIDSLIGKPRSITSKRSICSLFIESSYGDPLSQRFTRIINTRVKIHPKIRTNNTLSFCIT